MRGSRLSVSGKDAKTNVQGGLRGKRRARRQVLSGGRQCGARAAAGAAVRGPVPQDGGLVCVLLTMAATVRGL